MKIDLRNLINCKNIIDHQWVLEGNLSISKGFDGKIYAIFCNPKEKKHLRRLQKSRLLKVMYAEKI